MEWTVVRPGGLKNEPGTGGGLLTESRTVCGAISREDVAELVVKALFSANAAGKVPPASGGPGPRPTPSAGVQSRQIFGPLRSGSRCGCGEVMHSPPLTYITVRAEQAVLQEERLACLRSAA